MSPGSARSRGGVSHLLPQCDRPRYRECRSARSAAKPTQGIIRLASPRRRGGHHHRRDDGAGPGDRDLAELPPASRARWRLARAARSARARDGRHHHARGLDTERRGATFRSSDDHLLLARSTRGWALLQEWHRATPLDPVAALGLRVPDEAATTHTAVFGARDGDVRAARAIDPEPSWQRRAAGRRRRARGGRHHQRTEALLLRLDRLATPAHRAPCRRTPSLQSNGHEPPATQRSERRARTAHNVLLLDTNATWLVLTRAALLHPWL